MNVADIKQALLLKRKKPELSVKGALSTGSTLLNLACTDTADFGFLKGGYYYLVGDSASGKTWTSLTCFAQACLSPAFKDHRLIFDDVENGALMDIAYYFGKAVARRIEPPSRRGGEPVYSSTVESFYYHLLDILKAGKPFIYVLDSQDALTSDSSAKKFNLQKGASEKGEEITGSYGDGKAKYHSEHLRHIIAGLKRTGSILIIIGQTRDNLGFGFEKKTRSGGKALRFYATLEIWTSVMGKIKKMVRGKERTIGARCLAEVRKNRVTGKIGKDRSVEIPIYYGLGIDDVGSCVDYLVSEQHWTQEEDPNAAAGKAKEGKKKKKLINAHELLFQGTRNKLIAYIEDEDMEEKVRQLTAKVWAEVEAECEPQRKRRYE